MLVEAYQRIGSGGMDLPSAVMRVNESLGESVAPAEGAAIMEPVPSQVDNDRALADLQRMMGGIA